MTQEWEKLTPYQQVRLRTEWVFGSRDPHTQTVLEYGKTPRMTETTWVPALFTCFRELLDNALDEVITHGRGNRIDVTYDADALTFSVADNGRGIPIEWSDEHHNYAATILLSEMMSGRNFVAERGETRGLNGIGAKGVNYCAEWFKVEITRDKKQFIQTFTEGDDLQIGEPSIWPVTGKKSGTQITCKLSSKVFHDRRLPESFIAARLHEIALCYPKLHLTHNGKRISNDTVRFEQSIEFTVTADRFTSRFWLVPEFVADGDFAFSLVNAIPLFQGGTHIDAFRRHFYNGLLNDLERENRRRKLIPNRADVSERLLIYNITEMANPSFDSQSKTRLINEPVSHILRDALTAPDFFKEIIRKHPTWIDAIYERCAKRTKDKDEKDTARKAKRNLRQKIEDLEDACGHDRSKCILFLAEGDCLHQDTQIAVMRDGVIGASSLRDVCVGDLVCTHQGNIRPVVAKTSVRRQGLRIDTQLGDIIASANHRLLASDGETERMAWIAAKDLIAGRHCLVRSKVADTLFFEQLHSADVYDTFVLVKHGNDVTDVQVEIADVRKHYWVLDLKHVSIKQVCAFELDTSNHALVVFRDK